MIALFIYSSICLILHVYHPVLSFLLGLYFLIFKSFRHKYLFIILILLFQIRLNIETCEPIKKGRVVEINDKSILVNHNFTNVLISVKDVLNYNLQDEVIIYQTQALDYSPHSYGFDLMNYYHSRNICYTVREEDTYRIEGVGFFNWLSQGGYNQDLRFKQLSRTLLFQSNPNQDLDLFISMGVLYTSLIKVINLCFLKVKNRYYELICIVLVLCYMGFYLGYPLSLLRVLIFYLTSKFFDDRMLRFGINCLLCAFISPYGLTQLSFVLPLLFQFSALFLPMKSRFIQRMCVLIFVFILYNSSFSILNGLIYPLLFIFYRLLLSLTFIGLFIPYFNSIYGLMIEYLNEFYKLSQSLFVLKGHINLVFIFLFILMYHYTATNKYNSIVCLIFILLGIPVSSIPFFYTVTLINVGQGDSILIQAPFNQNVILIDTGSPYQSKSLMTYLDSQSIYTIDTLVLTHDDSDHSGNREELEKKYTVKEIVLKGKDIRNNNFLLDYLDFKLESEDDNDMSLVYQLTIYSKQFLFMGDLSVSGERKLMQHYPYLKADILKVGHHGSNTSTSDDFLKQIQSQIALIGVGKNNYGHPSSEILNRLNDYYIEIFDTYSKGDIKIILLPMINVIFDSNNHIYLFQ